MSIEYYKQYPWRKTLVTIKTRCNNCNFKFYKRYGGKGIKCLITEQEIKELWFRDKAYLMKKPSIDRKDNNGHYEFSNCEFIELSENSAKDKRNIVLQYDLKGNFIKEWRSSTDASNKLNINRDCIYHCCHNRQKTAGGFIWK